MSAASDFVASIGISPELQRQLGGSHNLAGSTVTVRIQGLAELEAALEQLPEKVAKKSLVEAMTEATEVFRLRAEELAPYDAAKKTGMHLIDGIKKEMRTGSHGVQGSWVHGRVALHPDVWYGRLIEFGWITAGSGTSVAAQPFMRPAFDSNKEHAVAVISNRLAAGIAAAARELHRQ